MPNSLLRRPDLRLPTGKNWTLITPPMTCSRSSIKCMRSPAGRRRQALNGNGDRSVPTSLTGSSPGSNPWKLGGLGWKALVRRLWRESLHDDILGRAAQLAYYFLLALFPALLFLTALIGLFPLKQTMPELMQYLRTVLPADALSLLEKYLENVMQGSSGDILSLGLLGALWASISNLFESCNFLW